MVSFVGLVEPFLFLDQPNNHVPFVTKSQVPHQEAVEDRAAHQVAPVHLVEVVDQADLSCRVREVVEEAAYRDLKALVHQVGVEAEVVLLLDLLVVVEVEAVPQVAQVLLGEEVVLVPRNLEVEVVVEEDQVELIFPSAAQADPVVVQVVVQVVEVLQCSLHFLGVVAGLVLEVNLVLMADSWFLMYLMLSGHTALTCSIRLVFPLNLQFCLREIQFLVLQFSKTFLHFQELT